MNKKINFILKNDNEIMMEIEQLKQKQQLDRCYKLNRKIQKLMGELYENKIIRWLEKLNEIQTIYKVRDFENKYICTDEMYILNELNKVGVDYITRNRKGEYNKIDIKGVKYNPKYYGNVTPLGTETILVQILNYNGADGWGISKRKITDTLLLYINGIGLYKVDYKRFRDCTEQIIRDRTYTSYIQFNKGNGRTEDCIVVPTELYKMKFISENILKEYQK